MTNVTAQPETEKKATKPLRRQFVNFAVYQIDPAWRRLPQDVRERGKQQFEKVIQSYQDSRRAQILTFSTMGMRADGDFVLWIISYDLEAVQDLSTDIAKTEMGGYLSRTLSFLSMTKRSQYMDRFNPEHPESRVNLVPGKYKYLFVYPFVKKREWYMLPMEKRQEMMDEHIRVGNKYPSVKLNTTYSFGLDDQEFVVAFESNEPGDFLDLVQELRDSVASSYTLRDTPILTCIKREVREMLDALGG